MSDKTKKKITASTNTISHPVVVRQISARMRSTVAVLICSAVFFYIGFIIVMASR